MCFLCAAGAVIERWGIWFSVALHKLEARGGLEVLPSLCNERCPSNNVSKGPQN